MPEKKQLRESCELGTWEATVAALKRHFRAAYPTVVQRRRMRPGAGLGETYKSGEKLYVVVNKAFSLETQILTLLHEYAHALAWRPDAQEEDCMVSHDSEWGIWHARIWAKIISKEGGFS